MTIPTQQLEFELTDAPEPKKGDRIQTPTTVARYRLSLVREPESVYAATLGIEPPRLSDPRAASRWLAEHLDQEPYETFGALFLDTKHALIGESILYRGTLNRAAVEPRGVLASALLLNAAAVIVFHNHPSGDPTPSPEDIAFTHRLSEACELVGLRLVDHLVIASAKASVSMAERGLLS
ncbi:MAG: hypothetical protein F9K34_17765 [Albidovulum sp.]|uniref:JAB domain-containing protein n=1 Tax=Albidovulum sp. TaxID=1872424 RepID=UPI001326CC9B|nr:JAB domain-containing protein [Defluviimonas sp.]KAB2878429.1 MAG: hypothetical protein F9K34_17765 [Defluviimonas sp.]